jgi:hypothetical protein
MTVAEIMEQAITLSVQERKELVKRLVDTLGTPDQEVKQGEVDEQPLDDEPWGKRLVRILEQTELADWGDPDIEDPVEAVEAMRRQEHARLDAYWNGDL